MLCVVSAPSGTGKTTVLTLVRERVEGIRFSVSHTTRPPRSGERDGIEYHFIERRGFEQLVDQGRFLEWAEVHGQLYGTSVDECERAAREGVDLLLDIDVQGAALVRGRRPEATSVFLLPPSRAALEERLRGRGKDSDEAVARRLQGAWQEVARWTEYDYVLVNQEAEQCARELEMIIRAARNRAVMMTDRAREIVRGFEIRMESGGRGR
jgi:guanylate kinase